MNDLLSLFIDYSAQNEIVTACKFAKLMQPYIFNSVLDEVAVIFIFAVK